ncbi:subclass B1 metallo-beta-lactamase [Lujinxingia vulgaris]|nr:subclass B1 metallo-beta-lactamase [Lujinxingia vulgaris]
MPGRWKRGLAMFIMVGLGSSVGACANPGKAAPDTQAVGRVPGGERAEVVFEELVPGVWLHLSHRRVEPWGDVPSYGLVVEREDGALLIDSAWTDAQTAEILAWTEDVLDSRVTDAVFTHAHADKMGGVGMLRERGVKTYAAYDSNQLAVERGLVPAEHAIAFGAEGEFRLGPAVVFDPGAGHTEDNIVVGLPEHGILFGGCLIRPAGATDAGNTADADLEHWDRAVEAVARRFEGLEVVVPSHGPPGGRELLALTIRLVRETRARDSR